MQLTLSWLFMQDVLDNNVTLKPDTVVHVWKWWPVATGASTSASAGASAGEAAGASARASARASVRASARASAGASAGAPAGPSTGASTGNAVHAVHAMPSDPPPGHAASALSNLRSDQKPGQHGSHIVSRPLTQQPNQQSRQQQPLHRASGPVDCQLSMGCPGEVGRYSAGEEPGWFPEMEKVTAQVCVSIFTTCNGFCDHYL